MTQPAPIKEPLVEASLFAKRVWIRWFQDAQNILSTAINDTIRITSADSPYTIGQAGVNLVCNTSGGSVVVNFPSGAHGAAVRVANAGDSGNSVTMNGNGNTILGSASKTLSDRQVLEVRFDSTEGWN